MAKSGAGIGTGSGRTKIEAPGATTTDANRTARIAPDAPRLAYPGSRLVQEPSCDAACQEADGVQRGKPRRSDAALEAETEGPECERVQEQVLQVGVEEAARHERLIVAALHKSVRSEHA